MSREEERLPKMEVDSAESSSSAHMMNESECEILNPNVVIPLPSCSTAPNQRSSTFSITAMEEEDSTSWIGQKQPMIRPGGDLPLLARFVALLDQIDNRVETLRKDAINLQEKRDQLQISLDLIKSNDLFSNLEEYEREEVSYYMQRVNSRLATVDLSVKTIRNTGQEECLHQVNILIDSLINGPDPVISRQKCQSFLNACSDELKPDATNQNHLVIDKRFENSLLGCTLDDQKQIKKRLQALNTYFIKRTVSD